MKGKRTIFGAAFAPVLALAVVLSGSVATSVQAENHGDQGYGGDSVSCTMHANPGTIGAGDSSTLIWYSSDNVVSASLEEFGDVDPEHWYWISSVDTSRTYTLTVYGADGQMSTCEAEIMVEGEDGGEVEAGTPSCSVTASPSTIAAGGETTLNWTSENAVSSKLSPTGSMSYFAEGSADGSWHISGITDSRSYSVTVYGADGSSSTCDVQITVEGDEVTEEEEEAEHTFCSITYPGRVMVDADGNGWGDTESDEAGCKMDPVTEEEEEVTEEEAEHTFCSITYPGRVMVDADGNGWGDTESDEAGCKMDPVTEEEEEVTEEEAEHTFCSITYPGRVMVDADGNGWGDTESDEAGCKMDPVTEEEEEVTEEEETTMISCSIEASPSTISAGGETTLVFTSEGAVTQAYLMPTGSSSSFAEVTPNGSWFISGISNSRSYSMKVMDADGNVATCDAPITVEETV